MWYFLVASLLVLRRQSKFVGRHSHAAGSLTANSIATHDSLIQNAHTMQNGRACQNRRVARRPKNLRYASVIFVSNHELVMKRGATEQNTQGNV